MSAYVEEIPLITKKSIRPGILFLSVCHYVVVPVDINEKFFSCITFDNSVPFVVVQPEPHRACLLLYSPPAINFVPSVS
jgi:hypothetical protein